MEHESAKPKGLRAEELREQESMRAGQGSVRRNPTNEDRKIRRSWQTPRRSTSQHLRTGGAMTHAEDRVELIQRVATATSLKDREAALEELQAFDRARTAQLKEAQSWDAYDTAPAPLPLISVGHSHDTISSDWLLAPMVATASSGQHHAAAIGEATLWYQALDEEVRQHPEEFAIQANYWLARESGKYGEQAEVEEASMREHLSFLNRKEGGSGVDQIQQTMDSAGNNKTTPLPTETQDTFYPPVADENAAAIAFEEQGSTNSPTLQAEIAGRPVQSTAALEASVSELQATVAALTAALREKSAASTTPIIQQTLDGQGNPAATPMPTDVAFPWEIDDPNAASEPSVGGPAGGAQGLGAGQAPRVPNTAATGRTARYSDSFTKSAAHQDPDFRKGYGYASSWKPGTKLVATGSKAFEAGLYSGITDNPEHALAFVAAHQAGSTKHPELGTRIAAHQQAASDLEAAGLLPHQANGSATLDSTGPQSSVDPAGQTPFSGVGTEPPLLERGNPADPGGPAPYNAAPPFGMAAVPHTPLPGVPQTPAVSPGPQMSPYASLSSEQRQAAFRRQVQSSLLKEASNG